MLKLRNKKAGSLLGLDISEKSIKLVELTPSAQGMVLKNFAIAEIPNVTSAEGKKGAIRRTLRKIFAEKRIEENKVFTSISGPKVAIRMLLLPPMPKEELAGAIRWEAKSTIPFPIDEVVIEYHVLGKVIDKGTEKLQILIAACESEALDEHLRGIEEAGLKCMGVTPLPFALWELIKPLKLKEDENIAFIDVGAAVTSINLFKNSVLRFTREINIAGESITAAMTGMFVSDEWKTNLTTEQAEKIKKQYGIPKEEVGKTEEGIPLLQISEVIKPTLRRILNEISRSFDYYKDHFRETNVEKVFLSGGSSKLKNFPEFLSTGLGKPVEILDPLQGIVIDPRLSPETVKESSGQLAAAIGLALGQGKTLNFIKKQTEAEERFEIRKILEGTKLPEISNIALISGIALILILGIGFNLYLKAKVGGLRKELKSKQEILEDVKALKERREILLKIKSEETRLRDTLTKFTATIPSGVTLSSLTYKNNKREMIIIGEANTVTLVGKFLKDIETSPYFSGSKLIETKKIVIKGKQMMSFKISLHVD